MPEPGIDDRDFDRPTTGSKKFRRRSKARVKLPGEYAEFRLSDGRILREVMGEGAFAPESGADGGRSITQEEREKLRDGNWPLARMMREDPRMAPRAVMMSRILEHDGAKIPPVSLSGRARFGSASAPVDDGYRSDVVPSSSGADRGRSQNSSEVEEILVPEEQNSLGLEQSRAAGVIAPPFEMIPPLPRIQARRDPAGGWSHGASRDGGAREHDGVDLLAEPGTPVRSPINGTVRRINFTTSGMATITLRNDDGQEIKFLYVAPVDGRGGQLLVPGAAVRAGQIIGTVEDLGEGYEDARTGRMKNHVHMRVSENGKPVNPFPWLAQWWGSPEGSGKNWYPRRHPAAPGIGNTPDYNAVGEGQRWSSEREQR